MPPTCEHDHMGVDGGGECVCAHICVYAVGVRYVQAVLITLGRLLTRVMRRTPLSGSGKWIRGLGWVQQLLSLSRAILDHRSPSQ